MATYYVRNGGSDSASGTSDANAWATISRVNTAMNSTINAGDEVLFKRGDKFYGRLNSMRALTSGPNRVWGAYGTGAAPIISNYKTAIPSAWVESPPGVWRLDLRQSAFGASYTGSSDSSAQACHIRVGGPGSNNNIYGNIRGYKRVFSLGALTNEWDFYTDNSFVYVKKVTSPGNDSPVEIAIALGGAWVRSRQTVQDLCFEGTGGDAIRNEPYQSGFCTNIEVKNCTIRDIGGALWSGTTCLGNGVQSWIGSANWDIHHNVISQCFDVAWSPQGWEDTAAGTGNGWTNINVHDNIIYNCTQGQEVWSRYNSTAGGTPDGSPGFVDCYFQNNLVINSGWCWGGQARLPHDGRLTPFLYYDHELPTGITVQNNVIYGARVNLYYTLNGTRPIGLVSNNNQIFIASGTKFTWHQGWVYPADLATFRSNFDLEVNSTFTTVGAGPYDVQAVINQFGGGTTPPPAGGAYQLFLGNGTQLIPLRLTGGNLVELLPNDFGV